MYNRLQRGPGVPLGVAGLCGGWPLAKVDRAHFSLQPPRDPLGPAAFGYLSGSYCILLRSRSLGAAMADAPDPGGARDGAN